MRCFINLISYLFLNSNFWLGRYNLHSKSTKGVKKTLLKTCAKPFKCKTSDWATTPQEFQEKKITKTKQRTHSDKQEKHKNKES